jgi:hypothetical protein
VLKGHIRSRHIHEFVHLPQDLLTDEEVMRRIQEAFCILDEAERMLGDRPAQDRYLNNLIRAARQVLSIIGMMALDHIKSKPET